MVPQDMVPGHSTTYHLAQKMVCNSHSTGAVALDVLQMILQRPALKRVITCTAFAKQKGNNLCVPSFKKASQHVASIVEDQLYIYVFCGLSNRLKILAGLTEIDSNLRSRK